MAIVAQITRMLQFYCLLLLSGLFFTREEFGEYAVYGVVYAAQVAGHCRDLDAVFVWTVG